MLNVREQEQVFFFALRNEHVGNGTLFCAREMTWLKECREHHPERVRNLKEQEPYNANMLTKHRKLNHQNIMKQATNIKHH